MLTDALSAETYRLWRNRPVVFWSTLFTPVAGLLLSIGGTAFLKQKIGEITQARLPGDLGLAGRLDLGQSLVDTAAGLAHPMVLLFVLIGAASVYAGDYRWETWRLISARDSRPSLILGKVGAVKLLALAAVALMLVLGLVQHTVNGFILNRPLALGLDGARAADAGLLTLVAYVRVVQVTLLGLLAAVLTRSLLAAVFLPLVVTVAQGMAAPLLPFAGWTPDTWQAQMLAPGLAHDTLKAAILGGAGGAPGADTAALAVMSLILWCALPLALAILLFQRQDLAKE